MLLLRYLVLAILFALTWPTVAQNERGSPSNVPEPKLPVIDYDACPGKSKPIPNVKLVKDDLVYSTPEKGKLVAKLGAGETVTVLAGANLIHQPDRAVIKYLAPDTTWPRLKVGDTVPSYGWDVDGKMVFWAKGIWFKEDREAVAEKGECGFTSGFGIGGCTIDIVKDGVIEWWVKVKTSKDVSGWVLAVRYSDDNRWYRWYGNFYDVLQNHCRLD